MMDAGVEQLLLDVGLRSSSHAPLFRVTTATSTVGVGIATDTALAWFHDHL